MINPLTIEEYKQIQKNTEILRGENDMAMSCIYGGECDGCMKCQDDPVMWDCYDTEIFNGEYYYEINDEIIAEDNINEWLKEFRKVASND